MTCLLLALATSASAQDAATSSGFDAHGFFLAADDGDLRDPLAVQRPGPFEQGDFWLTGLVEYADEPLVQVTRGQLSGAETKDVALGNLLALDLSAGVAVHDRARLDVYAPLYFLSSGLGGDLQGFAAGDVRVSAMGVLLRPTHIVGGGGPGAGVVGHLDLPTGDPDRFLGQEKLGGGLSGTGTFEDGPLTLSGELGFQFNPKIDLDNLTNSDGFVFGLAVGVLLGDTSGLTAELRSTQPFQASSIKGTGAPSEALLSFRHHLEAGPWVQAGAGAGISQGAGAARFRAFLGMGWGRVQPPRGPDTDAIGEVKVVDQCPDAPETKNGWKDDDGCPDDLGSVAVRATWQGKDVVGADLVVDGPEHVEQKTTAEPLTLKAVPGSAWKAKATDADACLAGETSGSAGEHGTELVVDMKPVLDGKVTFEVVGPAQEQLQPGTATWRSDQPSCLPTQTQVELATAQNGLAGENAIGHGHHTFVIDVPGYKPHEESIDVAPGEEKHVFVVLEPSLVVLTKTQIQILDKVYFEFNKAVIKPESFELLNQVADVINTHPDIGRVEVGGHTDDKGNDKYNLDLSQKRADAVRAYLIGRGVPADQLLAVGYGETRPIADNKTEDGRGQNRRVEFNLIDQTPPSAPPDGAPAPTQTPGGAP